MNYNDTKEFIKDAGQDISNTIKDLLNIDHAPTGTLKTYRTDEGKYIKIELFAEDLYINPDGSISVQDRLKDVKDGTYTGLEVKDGKLAGFINTPPDLYTPTSVLSPPGDHRIGYLESKWYWRLLNKIWDVIKFVLFKLPSWVFSVIWDIVKGILKYGWLIIQFVFYVIPKWFFVDVVGGVIDWLWGLIWTRGLSPFLSDEYARTVVGIMDWIREKLRWVWDYIYGEGYDSVLNVIRRQSSLNMQKAELSHSNTNKDVVSKTLDLMINAPLGFANTTIKATQGLNNMTKQGSAKDTFGLVGSVVKSGLDVVGSLGKTTNPTLAK